VTDINDSDRAVYLPMAQYVFHERLVDGAWRSASSATDGQWEEPPLRD